MASSGSKLDSRNFDTFLHEIVDDLYGEDNVSKDNAPDEPQVSNQDDMSHKVDLMVLNNGWNDNNERIVISLGENAASYKWMHEKSAVFYKTVHKVLSVVLIVFSTGLSAETIIPNNSLPLDILRRVFTYIITLLSVLQNFLKYEQLSEQHRSAATSFSQLYHDIQQQMCAYRRNRQNATQYVGDLLKQYDSLVVNGPNITARVVAQFKEAFKNADISIPDIADRIQKIEIISETPTAQQTLQKDKALQAGTEDNRAQKRYGRYGMCNLQQIHNAFQIHGDISDQDLQNANATELRDLRKKFLASKSDFEYQRFRKHFDE